ncbi:MAG: hypothetical protein ACYC7M_05850 [Bellilinea sp.]
MTQPSETAPVTAPPPTWKTAGKKTFSSRRIRSGLVITLLGLLIFLIGARPGFFGVDRSPVIGFIQIAVFLVGLALVCLGGYISLMALWKDRQTSISADIGLRLVATGYVISVFTGMADMFGFGSHPLPGIPYFGPWQALGVEIGQAVIALGFLLLIPLRPSRRDSSKKNPSD